MGAPANPVVVVPSRLGSTRLPEKPLALIAGEPMIVHVWRRAMECELGPVVVACDHPRIVEAVERIGGRAVLTDPYHPSGTDRIAEALRQLDPEQRHDAVLNFQGDLPTVAPHVSRAILAALADPTVDCATPVVPITDPLEADAPHIVKLVGSPTGPGRFRALYFTRARAPWGDGRLHHHIGLYAWRREGFERFAALPPSALEQREKLEQLRALEHGMRIEAVEVDDAPLGVDTPDDLARARVLLEKRPHAG